MSESTLSFDPRNLFSQKPQENDYSFRSDFLYRHKNPYHHRLEEFTEFVLRDHEAETFKGHWKSHVFKGDGQLHVEIGTGQGEFMMEFCQQNPQCHFIGLDYRFKRSFHLAKKLNLLPEKNFRYLRAKGERIDFLFAENEVDNLYYFFPDPWPKNKHHKKRLFQPLFLDGLYKILRPGGEIFIKTDHLGLYQWMQECSKLKLKEQKFQIMMQTEDLRREYPGHFLSSFETNFEKIFLRQGIKIKAFVLKSLKAF